MNITATIETGNVAELIEQNIEYHLGIGIDSFVICDLGSSDGTQDVLKKYEKDDRFLIKYFTFDDIPIFIQSNKLGSWMVDVSKERFQADWIVRMDGDEFLYPKGNNLKTLLKEESNKVLGINRYNIISSSFTESASIPSSWEALSGYHAVTNPFEITMNQYNNDFFLPLTLTRVGKKTLVRSDSVSNFTPGGHEVIDKHGKNLPGVMADNFVFLHFWFTTLVRFKKKLSFIQFIEPYIRKQHPLPNAWQWSRWYKLAMLGEECIIKEFERQYPSQVDFQKLLDEGTVGKVLNVFDR